MILGVWSASLTLPDYGRLARHAAAIACDGELRPEGGTCQVALIGPLPRIWVSHELKHFEIFERHRMCWRKGIIGHVGLIA